MAKTLGYMITWTTYGTWLQGDERGYVKNGKVLPAKPSLFEANKSSLKGKAVKLKRKEREIVREAIEKEAKKLGQRIYAAAVCSNHVHLVMGYNNKRIGDLVRHYKGAAYFALRKNGFVGRVWTGGYDKRYCFDDKSIKERAKYVRRHN